MTKEKLTPEEDVRQFILSLKGKGGTHQTDCKFIGDQTILIKDGPCHGALRPVTNPKSLGSAFLPLPKNKEAALNFWAWISNPKKSPWRLLLQNGIELVTDKTGLPLGWILPEKTLRETPFTFQKNFCILTRGMAEKSDQFVFWDELVKKGVREDDAMYLVSVVTKQNEVICSSNQLGGGHWALTDSIYTQTWLQYKNDPRYSRSYAQYEHYFDQFDWNAFRTGKINPAEGHGANIVINGHFCNTKKTDYKKFSVEGLTQKTTKGRFSSSASYDLEELLDHFYKWQDEEGIIA